MIKYGKQYYILLKVDIGSSQTRMVYMSYSFTTAYQRTNLPVMIISFYSDKTFKSVNENSELNIPTEARGLSVRSNESVTNAASNVGADLLYIRNNYALKSELPADELPTISAGDAGKVLTVNSGETGVEWAAAGGGSASMTNNQLISWNGTAASNVLGVYLINPQPQQYFTDGYQSIGAAVPGGSITWSGTYPEFTEHADDTGFITVSLNVDYDSSSSGSEYFNFEVNNQSLDGSTFTDANTGATLTFTDNGSDS